MDLCDLLLACNAPYGHQLLEKKEDPFSYRSYPPGIPGMIKTLAPPSGNLFAKNTIHSPALPFKFR